MSEQHTTPPATLVMPDALKQQLQSFRRALWRRKMIESVAAGLIGLVLSFLLVYLLDRVGQTAGWLRFAILVAGISVFGGFVPYWLHRWIWRQRSEAQLARLIAKRYPGLGDRLLGVIELQEQKASEDTLSPRLRQAAMESVANEVARRPLLDALPFSYHRRWVTIALVLMVLAILAVAIAPRAGMNAMLRWIFPFSDTQRYTFTRLLDMPVRMVVPVGEAFDVNLVLLAESEKRPATATARNGLQKTITSALRGDGYQFSFPGQQDPSIVRFSVGDLRHELQIEPMVRPGIAALNARVTLPAYLGNVEKLLDLSDGMFPVVEGSRISIELEATRELKSATFGEASFFIDGEKKPEAAVEGVAQSLITTGPHAKSKEMIVGQEPFEIPVSWQDTHGLSDSGGFRLRVEARTDAAPMSYLLGVDRQKVILPEETIDFEVLSEDDFGIKEAGIDWQGQQTRPSAESAAAGSVKLLDGKTDLLRNLQAASFSPAAFGIAPQKIMLRGYVEDAFPERGRVYSEPIVIYVLTRDEHAQLLKTRYDQAIAALEDIARRELNLLDENQRLEKMDDQALQDANGKERLENQRREEAESTRRMDEVRKDLEQLMKDAVRNGEIDPKTMQKMAQALKPVQELSQDDLPTVEQSLNEAQDPSKTPESAKKDLNEAVERQQKAVAKMQEAIEQANAAKRDFEAGTFINRLKKAASEQDGIAASMISAFEQLLGTSLEQVDPKDRRRLEDAAKQQINTAADVRWLQEDLRHYIGRVTHEKLAKVQGEMQQSQIELELEKVRSFLTENHTYQAVENSKRWAEQLTKWADFLSGADENAAGAGGGGGGAPNAEDDDFEFMLRVMKLVQAEQDIRGQTRVLEQLRRENTP